MSSRFVMLGAYRDYSRITFDIEVPMCQNLLSIRLFLARKKAS